MKTTTITILLLMLLKVNAQEKSIVAIMPFISSIKENRPKAMQLKEIVFETLTLKTNIEPLDRATDSLLNDELDRQMSDRSIASAKLVEQGRKIGAKHLIIGTLTDINVVENESAAKNGSLGVGILKKTVGNSDNFKASISFSLQIIDVETGKVISHRAFNNTKDKAGIALPILGTGTSKEQAIVAAMEDSKNKIVEWLNELYPAEIKIVRIKDKDKNGKPKTLQIKGVDKSLKEGDQLIIQEIVLIPDGNNKPLQEITTIGKLTIKEKQGDLTLCIITEGATVIEEKINNGNELNIKQLASKKKSF